ncbi:MAG: hypothetical protein GEU73_00165 [Chloroflexi bacterium]|nr:hypothetical protein [Chloroflexota bacterium]
MQSHESSGRFANPAVTRSRLVLEMAYELTAEPTWLPNQARVDLRQPGGHKPWEFSLFGSDAPSAIDLVARGEVQVAIVNPAEPLALAERGIGPFAEPVPLRIITVIPSYDQFAFAVREHTGLTSLADIRDQRFPLKLSMRDRPDHSGYLIVKQVLSALGFSMEDIVAWGGEVRVHGFPPDVEAAARGEVDAIFDEAVDNWLPRALGAGLRPLPLDEPHLRSLEAVGLRRGVIAAAEYPGLERDVPTLDFSGWPVYTHASVPDPVVRVCCAALEACKDRIPWQGEGPLPLERMCVDAPDTPLTVPLHPAAEDFWRERGYLS